MPAKPPPPESITVDATNLIVGRLASVVAKMLLSGARVTIVNAEKAVVSGKRAVRVREFKEFLGVKSRVNPEYGPIHPRRPDLILRGAIEGMLPKDSWRGRRAAKNLRVYIGVPRELLGREFQTVPEASAEKLKCPYVTLGEIAKEIGWKGG